MNNYDDNDFKRLDEVCLQCKHHTCLSIGHEEHEIILCNKDYEYLTTDVKTFECPYKLEHIVIGDDDGKET